MQPLYAELKSKFVQGLRTFEFSQQLTVFANGLEDLPAENASNNAQQSPNNANNIQIGGNVSNATVIAGDNATIHTESKESKRWRFFLFVFVPLLSVGFAYLLYAYWEGQKPLTCAVKIKNITPNALLQDLEKEGITPKDFEKIRKILQD